ncbi:MAG: RluA family pseudouridine synthase [Acidobacteriia bacterium]|nr:RluA family pseudouridine synthase [Terriglobia bacterium]
MKLVLPTERSLLEAVRVLVPGASNRTLRQLLQHGRVRLNGETSKIAARRVAPGDRIEIVAQGSSPPPVHGLKIVYEDKDILLVEKPPGLLTVATPHEQEKTAYAYLRQYVKERDARQKLFIVHRLDKFASGVLVFAKSEPVQTKLQSLFSSHNIQRKYWAVVEGHVSQNHGTIRSHLAENRARRMHSTEDESAGKEAVTHYRVLRRFPRLTTLEVTLETGRKNQIRVHLAEMGHPIVGDRAYGSTSNPMGRLGLHAFLLGFRHPALGIPIRHETKAPPEFARYLPK